MSSDNRTVRAAAVQAAPEFMQLDATVDKACALIADAARAGCDVIAFPECWVPGYPWYIWLNPTALNMKYFAGYHDNCLSVDSDAYGRVAAAAREHGIHVSLGASERDHGSLYIAQFLIGPDGETLKARRKLKPTHVERTVFGEGDGSDLCVVNTALGNIGQLSCWEHLQPLTKYAMFAQHEEIHMAAWPSFSCYPDAVALGPEVNNGASRQYAVEGQCFVLAPCGVISAAMIETLVENDMHAGLLLEGGGHARIYAPDGRELGEALGPADEGLVIADLDFAAITVSKCFADPVGHYARPDVTALLFNPEAQPPLVERRLPHRRGGGSGDEPAAVVAAEASEPAVERL